MYYLLDEYGRELDAGCLKKMVSGKKLNPGSKIVNRNLAEVKYQEKEK